MNKIEKLMQRLCPDGVEFVPIWSVTKWSKRFKNVDNYKQNETFKHPSISAGFVFSLEDDRGDVQIFASGSKTKHTTALRSGDYMIDGEFVFLPSGCGCDSDINIRHHNGLVVYAKNYAVASNNESKLLNKFIYYFMLSKKRLIKSYYNGVTIHQPDMAAILDIKIPIPPLAIQQEIVAILDMSLDVPAEITMRRNQYEYYREKLLTFKKKD